MQHFRLISDFTPIGTRSFGLADTAILNPTNANPLIMGEFLEIDSSYKMARGSVTPAAVPSFAYFAEQGAYDVQGLGKGPFLYLNSYEAETLVVDTTGLAAGDGLEVSDITYGGLTRRGLQKLTTGHVIGYVTRVASSGWVRFIRLA